MNITLLNKQSLQYCKNTVISEVYTERKGMWVFFLNIE